MASVLIVDDDPNNRLLLATLLKHAGHEPVEAADGNTALAAVAQEVPGLIIVDLSLPDMTGTALIKRLRREPRTANAKIALYSATRSAAAVQELTDLYGICGVIPKPGDPQEVLAILRELLERAPHS
ncbi:MAG TPA: response regulator [Candidatus Baltobacteraceae bacterium]|nr:response regulator [Candidatus Baltobacteraceae bacterium]